MNKEQTPIEELVIKLADLYTDLGNAKRPDQGMKLVSTITEEIEKYTKAKVLEALEKVRCKAEKLKEDAEQKILKSEDYRLLKNVHSFYVDYIETEVKPKYK